MTDILRMQCSFQALVNWNLFFGHLSIIRSLVKHGFRWSKFVNIILFFCTEKQLFWLPYIIWIKTSCLRHFYGFVEGHLTLFDRRFDVGQLFLLHRQRLQPILTLLFVNSLLQRDVSLERRSVQCYRLLKRYQLHNYEKIQTASLTTFILLLLRKHCTTVDNMVFEG